MRPAQRDSRITLLSCFHKFIGKELVETPGKKGPSHSHIAKAFCGKIPHKQPQILGQAIKGLSLRSNMKKKCLWGKDNILTRWVISLPNGANLRRQQWGYFNLSLLLNQPNCIISNDPGLEPFFLHRVWTIQHCYGKWLSNKHLVYEMTSRTGFWTSD